MGQVSRKESICTVSVHVPPMVGSVHLSSALVVQRRTRLMAETLPLRKTRSFCLSFVRPPSHARGYFGLLEAGRIVEEEQRHDGNYLTDGNVDMGTLLWRRSTRGTYSFFDRLCSSFRHLFFSVSHFFQPVCFSSSCVYVSNKKKKKKKITKKSKTCVCLNMSRSVVLHHQAADKTLMLTH